ncbi:hypothetical protein BGM05_23245 [Vibrio parahaemolyticus]|nr:hypothetical protein BGM05_23245 [Vibrio parahaemolyticus]
MRVCENCIGEKAIRKFVKGGSVNLRIIERAANKIGVDLISRENTRKSLLGVSDILQARRVKEPEYEDVKQVLSDCGINAACSCTS